MTTDIMRILFILIALSWAATTFGQSEEWYVSGSIIYNNDDADRAIDDSLSGIQCNAGKNITEHLSLEGMLDSFTQRKSVTVNLALPGA